MEFSFINTKYENKRNRRKERLLWEIKMREQLDIKDMQIKMLENEIKELKKQKQEALDFINQECTYDSHLCGFCRGLKPGEVKTLVYKLGGRNVKD
jgi:hypothetical protein